MLLSKDHKIYRSINDYENSPHNQDIKIDVFENNNSSYEIQSENNYVSIIVVEKGSLQILYSKERSVFAKKGSCLMIITKDNDNIKLNNHLNLNNCFYHIRLNRDALNRIITEFISEYPEIMLLNNDYIQYSAEGIIVLQNFNFKDYIKHLYVLLQENEDDKELSKIIAIKLLVADLLYTEANGYLLNDNCKVISKLSEVVNFIKKNISHKISIDQLSKIVSLSKSKIYTLFKDEFGQSPYDYILVEKMNIAKKLLLQNYAIKEVAYEVGFNDVNYFSRIFKKLVGETPKKFQNK